MTTNDDRADDARLAALAERAERGELPVPEGAHVRRGTDRDAVARELLALTGTDDPDDAARILAGVPREGAPRVGEGRGPSPVFKGRISHELRGAVKAIQEAEGLTDSEVQRLALSSFVARYQAEHSPARLRSEAGSGDGA